MTERSSKNSIVGIIGIAIPIAAIYLYTATVWTQFGYDSYFGIPSNYIGYSIRENILFSYVMWLSIEYFMATIHWYGWALIFILGTLAYWSPTLRKIILWIFAAFLLVSLFNFVKLGDMIARNKTDFFTIASECNTLGTTTKYVIPELHDSDALLVPYTTDENHHNKLIGGFVVKNLSELNCRIVEDYQIGKLEH
jgi:hypothetical protein